MLILVLLEVLISATQFILKKLATFVWLPVHLWSRICDVSPSNTRFFFISSFYLHSKKKGHLLVFVPECLFCMVAHSHSLGVSIHITIVVLGFSLFPTHFRLWLLFTRGTTLCLHCCVISACVYHIPTHRRECRFWVIEP